MICNALAYVNRSDFIKNSADDYSFDNLMSELISGMTKMTNLLSNVAVGHWAKDLKTA